VPNTRLQTELYSRRGSRWRPQIWCGGLVQLPSVHSVSDFKLDFSTRRILGVPNSKRVARDINENKGLEGAIPPATILGGESIVVAMDFINATDSVADGWDTAVAQYR
jgi:hypothetical protein